MTGAIILGDVQVYRNKATYDTQGLHKEPIKIYLPMVISDESLRKLAAYAQSIVFDERSEKKEST